MVCCRLRSPFVFLLYEQRAKILPDEYGLYLLIACSFTELETGGLFEFVLLSPPVVLLVLLLVKIRLTSDSTVSA
jgi:hypothetical protein